MPQSPGALVRLPRRVALPSCGKGLGRLRRPVEGAGPGAAAAGRLEDRQSATDPDSVGFTVLDAGRCVVAAIRRAVAFTWATAVVLRRCPARVAARNGANACELHSCNQQGENRRQFRSGHHRFLYHFPPMVLYPGDSVPRDHPGARTDVRKEGCLCIRRNRAKKLLSDGNRVITEICVLDEGGGEDRAPTDRETRRPRGGIGIGRSDVGKLLIIKWLRVGRRRTADPDTVSERR